MTPADLGRDPPLPPRGRRGGAAGGGLEVLLGHPGGPFFARRDLGALVDPEGRGGARRGPLRRRPPRVRGGDRARPAATRHAIPLGTIVQKGGKVVHAWALEGDLDPAAAVSNTFSMALAPGSGTLTAFPEIDRVAWFAPEEARRRLKEAQAPFLDRLEEALGPG